MKENESLKASLLEKVGNLSPERRALLALSLSQAGDRAPSLTTEAGGGGSGQRPPIPRSSRESHTRLSFAQQRLWFLDRLQPGNIAYNMPEVFRLTGSLDKAALEACFNAIIERQESLRTRFVLVNGEPAQVVDPAAGFRLPAVDLSGLGESEREAEARRVILEEARRPFDLTRGPVIRVSLLALGESDHALLVTLHHIISDGWSMGILTREMLELYEAFSGGKSPRLPDLPIQYADYARWQRERLQGDALDEQLSYWRRQLEGAPVVLELPSDRPRPAALSFRGSRIPIVLSEELARGLKALSRKEDASLFMTLLALFNILLYRYTGQEDIVVGSPIANRTQREVEGLIGFFANTLALRTKLDGAPTVRELIRRAREAALGAYAHQEMPFEKLVEELQPERDMSRQPLFQVMLVLMNTPTAAFEVETLSLKFFGSEILTSKFDLTLTLADTGEGLRGVLEYNSDIFDRSTIERMAAHFEKLAEAAIADPEQSVSFLPMLTEDERRQLRDWNSTGIDYGRERCVQEIFKEAARSYPGRTALIHGDESITFRELDLRSNRLAHYLRSINVGPDSPVGIFMERSIEMVVAVLGVLKAGGAYVPLDPAYPQERLSIMLEDSRAGVLLSQERLAAQVPENRARVVCLDSQWAGIAGESAEPPRVPVAPQNLAYIIYTSGSTGRPKGVAMSHAALWNLIEWQYQYLGLREPVATLQFSSLSFDASFNEMFSSFRCGGTLVLLSEEARRDPVSMMQVLKQRKAARLFPPFAALQQLSELSGADPDSIAALREVMSTAEQLRISPGLAETFKRIQGCRLVNEYGPSETHVVTAYEMAAAPDRWPALPPIGKPIANTQILLLSRDFQPVPVGVPGHLYIGGVCLARGYFNRPDLTAERFIPNPQSEVPGAVLYKTGDLARYLSDGNIEYLGRLDHQVKIRGYRIELGEIETALARHPSVYETVVLAREDRPGEKRIVAYVTPHQGESLTVGEMLAFLRSKLPEYMMPAALVLLDSLPLNANGKVDRRALPEPEHTRPDLDAAFVAPRTAAEEVVAGIWASTLGIERVGVYDNFFELGGHSLLAAQVTTRAGDIFQQSLPLRSLLENPTVEGMVAALAQAWDSMEIVEEIAATFKEIEELSGGEIDAVLSTPEQFGAEGEIL